MDKTSTLLFALLFIGVIGSGIVQYRTFVLRKNYVVTNYISCDPSLVSCFISDCSLENDEECDLEPYKKIATLAKNIPECSTPEECAELTCISGQESCTITECSLSTVEEGERCSEEPEKSAEMAESPDAEDTIE